MLCYAILCYIILYHAIFLVLNFATEEIDGGQLFAQNAVNLMLSEANSDEDADLEWLSLA